jgi:hypothetical protein
MATSVDTKQLRQHVFELAATGRIAPTAVEAVSKLAAQRIQGMARQTFAGTRHWKHVPRAISWDVDRDGTQVKAQVGYERGGGGQASLAHLLEYGSSRQGPIKPHLGPALDANADPFEDALLAAVTAPLAKGIGKMGRLAR